MKVKLTHKERLIAKRYLTSRYQEFKLKKNSKKLELIKKLMVQI